MLKIRELLVTDKDDVIGLFVECFGAHMRDSAEMDTEASLSDYPYKPITFLGYSKTTLVCAVQCVTSYFYPNTYSIAWLCTLPQSRRQGFASQLLQYAENFVYKYRFKESPGTLMLVAGYNPAYYERHGYEKQSPLHDGKPLMLKIIGGPSGG